MYANKLLGGGIGFYSVALDGLTSSAEEADAPPSSTSSSTQASSPTPTPPSPTAPSVVTPPAETVIVTSPPIASSTSTTEKKSGTNVAAIAAGVVIGFLGLAAIAAGVFFFMRHKRRREIEEEHRRNAAVSSFIGSQKPPTTSAGSSFTDTRLDPVVMAGRRISDGSIADNQDYSRRILKVCSVIPLVMYFQANITRSPMPRHPTRTSFTCHLAFSSHHGVHGSYSWIWSAFVEPVFTTMVLFIGGVE